MSSFRASAVSVWATALIAAAVLTGCASSRLSSQPPPGVRLAGDWKLDTARSDDLGKAAEGLRAQGAKTHHSTGGAQLLSSVPRGDYLRITVSSSAFTVISGDSSDQYTPGLESEVSAEQGDARQISGWKGAGYVIDTKPQRGPEIIQSYGLTKDGRLTMAVRLAGGGTHFTFTRVYDRTTRVAPLAPPTND